MGDPKFTELLAEKKKREQHVSMTSKRRLGRWRMSLGELGMKMRNWLDDPIKKGVLELTTRKKQIAEELVGTYEVNVWDVKLGSKVVTFEPIATYVIGAFGRVDVKGPAAGFRLIRESDTGHWSMADPSDPRRTTPLTKELFQEILLSALG